eukprot:Rmarinus@m.27681
MYVYVLVMQQRALLALSLTHTTPPGGRMCVSHYTSAVRVPHGVYAWLLWDKHTGVFPPTLPPVRTGCAEKASVRNQPTLPPPLCGPLSSCFCEYTTHTRTRTQHTHIFIHQI